MFHRQSRTYTDGSSSANRSAIAGSIRPLPLNPRLMTGVSNCRPTIAGKAMPGRDARRLG